MSKNPPTVLQPLQRSDIATIVELRKQHSEYDQHDPASSMESLPGEAALEAAVHDGMGVVARDGGGAIVAYGSLRTWQEQNGPHIYLVDGYVAPPARGSGTGTEILHALENAAREHARSHDLEAQAVLGANASSVQPDAEALLLNNGYKHAFSQVEMRLADGAKLQLGPSNSTLPIRRARVDDAGALCELTARVWAEREFFVPPTQRAFVDWLSRSDLDLFDVIEDPEGTIIAFVAAELYPTHAEIDDLQVDPAYQRRGIATTLMVTILKRLSKQGVSEIRLNTEGHDPAGARALYERLGFDVHRTYHRYRKLM